LELIPRDIYNLLAGLRIEELDGKTPIEWLLEELKAKGFSPKEYVNPKTKRLERLFFAHPQAVEIYKQHPNVLLMDCTYKTNRFRMPLLNICSVTGNRMTVQVAFCFLSGEKKESYEWAMEAFEELRTGHMIGPPSIVVTDRELALMGTFDVWFPVSAHILCT
jgi:hypothetical protein